MVAPVCAFICALLPELFSLFYFLDFLSHQLIKREPSKIIHDVWIYRKEGKVSINLNSKKAYNTTRSAHLSLASQKKLNWAIGPMAQSTCTISMKKLNTFREVSFLTKWRGHLLGGLARFYGSSENMIAPLVMHKTIEMHEFAPQCEINLTF